MIILSDLKTPVVIAEIGTLHLKTKESQYRATRRAFEAGADYVKTQLINPSTAWWMNEERLEEFKKINWHEEDWFKYFTASEWRGFVFASVFDVSFLTPEFLTILPMIKLGASAQIMLGLFKKALKSGKQTIISVENLESLYMVLSFCYDVSALDPIFLYVQSKYPTFAENQRLPVFRDINGPSFNGLSYHGERRQNLESVDYRIDVLRAAIQLGAKIFELHVQDEGAEGPDTKFAFTMEEFRLAAKAIHEYNNRV